jgi:tRNA-specific 2-thiouridylase
MVCDNLDIPHYTIDGESLFKKEVIDYFIKSYKTGCTPNPCIICNERVKFPLLLKKADETGTGYIATGHYARRSFNKQTKRFVIKEGNDKGKDQSYVLFSLSQHILSRLLLPIGDFKKYDIRGIARRIKLNVHNKKDSQEVCFIPENNLKRFLEENIGRDLRPGNIVDIKGEVLGRHKGICFYTIGQRKGLGIPFGRPLYVIDIRCRTNEVVVGEIKDTLRDSLIATDVSWSDEVDTTRPVNVWAKIRYRNLKTKAVVAMIGSDTCKVDFSRPQSSPAPGQAVVFYKKTMAIGGGWIKTSGCR